ncbi:hypothetical protein [Niveispirillum sp.]|uniref:hypothetical protein n=1 Tax=Niveispirillum sp. TaxID=1917217 RepID=UPI001B6126DF|nr:hypothetical protein [Niveispirillum sp.]MBP7339736.1 hypothetical protein [Niveispirillum sp.]
MVSSVSGSSNVLTSGSTSVVGTTVNATNTTTVTGAADANSAISGTTKKLSEIEKQLAEFATNTAKANKKAEAQSKVQVQTFEKQVRKSPYSTNGAATDIGTLVKDTTRLNVYSNLKKDDKGDVFKVRVQSSGEAQLGVLGDPGLRVQLMSRYGAVVADSKEGLGSTSDNFTALKKGELKIAAGDYYIKVSHDGNGPVKDSKGNVVTSKNYAIQMSMGIYRKDYDTVAQQPKAGDGMPQQSAASLELQNMLTAAQSFDTGLSGTAKLNNALFG